jgi:flagellin
MPFRVNTNVASVFVQQNLTTSQRRLEGNFEKLSSGLRINRASDDAAGLAVSEIMRAEIKSLRVATRNTADGINMVQVAEGGLGETTAILSRMRELAVQSSSGLLQAQERGYLATEFVALQTEMDRIANTTAFNGLALGSGANASVDIQVGQFAAANNRLTVTLQDARSATLLVDTATIFLTTDVTSQTAITAIDTALDSVNTSRASYGAAQNRLQTAMSNVESYTEKLVATESTMRDVDFASETADLSRNQVFQQAGVAILSQANQSPQAALSLLQ